MSGASRGASRVCVQRGASRGAASGVGEGVGVCIHLLCIAGCFHLGCLLDANPSVQTDACENITFSQFRLRTVIARGVGN